MYGYLFGKESYKENMKVEMKKKNLFLKFGYGFLFLAKQLILFSWAEVAAIVMTILERHDEIKNAFSILGVYLICTTVAYIMLGFFERKVQGVYEKKLARIQYDIVKMAISGNGKIKKHSELEVINRLTDDLRIVFDWKTKIFPELLLAIVGIIGLFGYLGCYNMVMTLSIYLILILNLFVPVIYNRHMVADYSEVMLANDKWANRLQEAVQNFSTIKNLGAEKEYVSVYKSDIKEFTQAVCKANRTFYKESGLKNGMNQFVQYMGYIIVGFFAFSGEISLPTLTKVILIIPILQNILNIFVQKYSERRNVIVSTERILDLLPHFSGERMIPDEFSLSIECLTFGYDNENMLFEKLSYRITQGEKVLIKGENGTGKSTLLKLLTGLYQVNDGQIMIGNASIQNIPIEWFQEHVYYLPQNTLFIPGTVKDNFAFRGLDFQDEVDKNLLDYNMVELSEGQKKQINLKELYHSKKQILLLDEPENHLDQENLKELVKFLQADKRTILIVTHTDSFDYIADRIWHLNSK